MIALALLVNAQANEGAALTSKPLLNEDLAILDRRGDLERWRVELHSSGGDLARLEMTGVVIRTLESDYAVIEGDRPRIEQVRALGFTTRVPVEADYRIRRFRVRVASEADYVRLGQIVSDIFPERPLKFPMYVQGRAYDNSIGWARQLGFDIERCDQTACK